MIANKKLRKKYSRTEKKLKFAFQNDLWIETVKCYPLAMRFSHNKTCGIVLCILPNPPKTCTHSSTERSTLSHAFLSQRILVASIWFSWMCGKLLFKFTFGRMVFSFHFSSISNGLSTACSSFQNELCIIFNCLFLSHTHTQCIY